jgi:endonuclease YncB( thermonuclease family)
MLTFRSVLVLACMALAPPLFAAEPGVRVIDGDTIDVQGTRIRLFGIDAPETQQTCERGGTTWRCGQWSSRVLAEALDAGTITCAAVDRDRYSRIVAICHAGGVDLGQYMVRAGAARAYVRYSDRYLGDEAQAKASRTGLWAATMISPEAFRHSTSQNAKSESVQTDCTIKGNIGTSGKIYHMPGQHYYAKTQISPAKGEAWFCSAAEARAAGFRAAKR